MNAVLARRYRPQTFSEVIGQEATVTTLRNAISAGRVAHGFIFSGPRGVGKTTVARILAKAMNCRSSPGPTPEPCGVCDACREIRDGNAVDVIEIDAASNRGIDEIRALRDSIRYRPARDRFKLYILDEAHQLTADAFNALLKTLEEPPEWAVFILATTEPEALPATIRSRCQHFAFRPVSARRIRERLEAICQQEQVPAEEAALDLLAEAGEGSIRDALSLLDQAIAYGGGQLRAQETGALLGRISESALAGLMAAVAAADSAALLAGVHDLLATGTAPAQLCRQWALFVREMLRAKIGAQLEGQAAASAAAEPFSEEDLTRFLQILLRANGELRWAPEPRLHLELAAVKMAQARRLAAVEDLVNALRNAPGGGAAPTAPTRGPGGSPAAGAEGGGNPGRAQTAAPPSAAIRAAAVEPSPSALPGSPEAGAKPPSAAGNGGPGPDRRAAVLATLSALGKAAAAAILARAEWIWGAQQLELVFSGGDAPLAHLAKQEDLRKALREACRAATGGNPPEITVRAVAEAEARAGAAGGDRESPPARGGHEDGAEARAARHPALRQLRELLPPHHVVRTIELAGPRGASDRAKLGLG